jgi:hypothetical protein
MGVNSGPISVIEGLIYCLDPANPRSYPGTGTSVTELSRVSANPTLNAGVAYYANPKGYFEFDGVNDNIPFTLTNFGTTTTVEIWMKMKAFVNGMPFGFNSYDVYAGSSAMGFNTAAGDIYGLTSTQVTNLGLLNQWKHYVFEMRSDVSYTNNKIYINGQSQTLSQVSTAENAGNRTFNSGSGRISCWLQDNNYHQPMDIALFRVYNRALTQTEITNNYNAFRKRFFPDENIISNGLILYLDAANTRSYTGIGLTAYSVSSIGSTAILTNGPTYKTANGGSFVLDGTNDYIYAPIDTTLFTTQATMIIWLKNDVAIPAPSQTGISGYFGAGGGNDHYPWADGAAYMSTFRNGRIGPITLSASIGRTSAHMLTITADTTSWKLYQNTTLITTQSGLSSVYLDNFNIGTSGGTYYYQGNIYVFMIYNRALSTDEILQNYNALKQRFGLA